MATSPERTFRFGNVSASVFVQESGGNGSPKRKFRTVNVQRSYRKEGDEQPTFVSNFTMGDLPAAIRAMQVAQSYVEEQEAGAA